MSDLVERVARAMWMADVEPYDPENRIPFEQAPETARAYCLAEARAAIAVALEEAAKVADAKAITPDAACEIKARSIAAAIRAMIPKEEA